MAYTLEQQPRSSAEPRLVITTLFISNLHCSSCVNSIEATLHRLRPSPASISHSIISHYITVCHTPDLPVERISQALESAGFEVHSIFQKTSTHAEAVQISPEARANDWEDSLEQAVKRWRKSWRKSKDNPLDNTTEMGKRQLHAEQCSECRAEVAGKGKDKDIESLELETIYSSTRSAALGDEKDGKKFQTEVKPVPPMDDEFRKDAGLVIEAPSAIKSYRAELSIGGMTCSACVGSITRLVEEKPYVRSINVSLLTNSATVEFEGDHSKDVAETIEDAGFDASLESVEELKPKAAKKVNTDVWKASYAIGGMTCSACVGSITTLVSQQPFVEQVDINLISHSGTVVFRGRENADKITETIEDAGFDAALDEVVNVGEDKEEDIHREIQINIDGMYCKHCPPRIVDALTQAYTSNFQVETPPTISDSIMKLKYIPNSPHFTIRHILNTISGIDQAFVPSIYHPPSIEDRARAMHARERRRILFRLALAVSCAVPSFVIGIVCMQLLMDDNAIRMEMMHPMWAGTVTRAEWALFILATPVYFFAADAFHRKAIKELKALWRPGSQTPILQRFYRFGSMNMLMSLGTSIAYFSSIAELGMAATTKMEDPAMMDAMIEMQGNSFYFDSVVFLTMFLLIGRFLEAYSKAKTGDAVTSLGKLRPTEAILIEETDVAGRKIPIDLLEVGDIVRVANGSSPPFDGCIVDGVAKFDESSLTGESRPVDKDIGDTVFAGTVNKTGPVSIRISSISGTSMLDQIIKVVREGQTKRAPIERAADVITGHFVPFVVAVGLTTWLVWLSLGQSGVLPKSWLDSSEGGWPLWSLRFAIAVFVIACPCGIGLAAPTAMFVGGGMAAKNGILVKGGGEAFQEASTLDCIVFDKTGTLTTGGDPKVTDYRPLSDDDEMEVLTMVRRLEEESHHPVARAVVEFCTEKTFSNTEKAPLINMPVSDIEEVPGKGMKGKFKLDADTDRPLDVDCIVGNEALMTDYDVDVSPGTWAKLQYWKRQGKSVVLLAIRASDPFADPQDAIWTLSAIFAIADALRPEAAPTVAALRQRGIQVWMLSGDNPTTAQAVAAMVGIPKENVIAGVLPDQKAEKIQYLQKSLPKPKSRRRQRATVAMVGDGINDSPALTMADVGIAIGSGSDIAISSAEFILISSTLTSILTLIDLSRAVFRRVWFNFGWALVYNIIAMPIAAGILYPIKSKGTHIRLDPVWASLAMALSSVSVVCSSLLLRSRIPILGFRAVEHPTTGPIPDRRERVHSMYKENTMQRESNIERRSSMMQKENTMNFSSHS